MKIKYTHTANPGVEKTLDTEQSLKGSLGLLHAMGKEPTQEGWDKEELARLKQAKRDGSILFYRVES